MSDVLLCWRSWFAELELLPPPRLPPCLMFDLAVCWLLLGIRPLFFDGAWDSWPS